MQKKTTNTLALFGLLVTTAGTLCTVGTPPAWLTLKLGISGNVIFFTGIGLLCSGIVLFLWRVTTQSFIHSPRKLGPQAAKKTDLKEVYLLYLKNFGTQAPKLKQMRRWHNRNPNIFQIIVAPDPETRKRKIVASFKVVPLKDKVIPSLEFQDVTGSTLPEEYIAKTSRGAAAWYIGDLVSTSHSSARSVLRALVDYLDKNLVPGIAVYARPLTEKGFEYLQKHNFEAVDGQPLTMGTICRLMGQEVSEEMGRLRSATSYRAAGQTKDKRQH